MSVAFFVNVGVPVNIKFYNCINSFQIQRWSAENQHSSNLVARNVQMLENTYHLYENQPGMSILNLI